MGAWLDLGNIHDFVAGAESDSGYLCEVSCPSCECGHLVTLSTLRRFLYVCNGAVVSGEVQQETLDRGHVRRVAKDPSSN